MEHILQFGITIDDDAIKKRIEKSATEKVVDELVIELRRKIFDYDGTLSKQSVDIVKSVLSDHTDQIVEKATLAIIESLKKSKKYKEALAKIENFGGNKE